MKTELKDVLHLYYSAQDYYTVKTPNGVEVLWNGHKYPVFHCFNGLLEGLISECKLILRPLSDMTEDEHRQLYCLLFKEDSDYRPVIMNGEISQKDRVGFKITYLPPASNPLDKGYEWVKYYKLFPAQFVWALQKGFDLFGLIESGQAITFKFFEKK